MRTTYSKGDMDMDTEHFQLDLDRNGNHNVLFDVRPTATYIDIFLRLFPVEFAMDIVKLDKPYTQQSIIDQTKDDGRGGLIIALSKDMAILFKENFAVLVHSKSAGRYILCNDGDDAMLQLADERFCHCRPHHEAVFSTMK